ncbi:MAG: hypothetical protein LBJ76_05995 [Candidatus Accumulibacter sp.]|jgi:hypothetical protein|nr:hypothetical protein [Accumulibacter sp.]
MATKIIAEFYADPVDCRLTIAPLPGLDKIEYLEARPAKGTACLDTVVRGNLAYRVVGPRIVSNERLLRHAADAEAILRQRAGKSEGDAPTWEDAVEAADRRIDIRI